MSSPFVPPAAPSPFSPTDENVRRGALAALLTIPAGVLVWLVLWGFGFIASLVGALVAVAAVRLYLWGAGRLSRVGAAVVLAVTVVTLLLAFFSGIVLDAAKGIGDVTDLGAWGAFTSPHFWPTFWDLLPDALPDYYGDFAWALGFGALGSFSTLRGAFAPTGAAVPGVPVAPVVPAAPAEARPAPEQP